MGDGVAWDLLAQYPNAGAAFSSAFQQGMQKNQQLAARNALSAYATDPNNQQAFGQALAADPSTAISLMNAQTEKQRYSQAQTQAQTKEWHSYAAQISKWADTPEKWDQGVDFLLQQNHPDISTPDLMALRGKFSPALRQSFMSLGGVQDDKPDELTTYMEKGGIDPNSEQGRSMYGAAATNRVDPQQPIQTANPDGTITVNWVRPPMPGMSGGMPKVSTPQEAAKLPPGTKFELPDGRIGTVPGGDAGGNASGNFPPQ